MQWVPYGSSHKKTFFFLWNIEKIAKGATCYTSWTHCHEYHTEQTVPIDIDTVNNHV